MNIFECIASIGKAIVHAFTPNTDLIKNQKYNDKRNKQYRKRRIKMQYQELFATLAPEELQIIQLLCENNNRWIFVARNYLSWHSKMLHNDAEEDIYQTYTFYDEEYCQAYPATRINPCLFPKMQKALKKHGLKRLQALPPFTRYEWYTPEEEADVQV